MEFIIIYCLAVGMKFMCRWHLMIFAITKMKAEMNSLSLSFLSLTYFKIPYHHKHYLYGEKAESS